jgi:AraC family ethanolamine operon transcriptional activator
MQLPQIPQKPNPIRGISTSNMEELAKFLGNRNRRYTQLGPGVLQAEFLEASLENVHIFKEAFNVGTRIEAAPASSLIPFGYILSASTGFKFCGNEGSNNTFLQASGGVWDLSFKDQLEYIGCAFDRDYFCTSYELLKGRPVDKALLTSQFASPINNQQEFAVAVSNILLWVEANPFVYLHSYLIRLLCSQVFKLTIDSLPSSTDKTDLFFRKHSKRVKAAKRTIEYINIHAKELPDMQTLCKVAEVSERSLQNGFIDYIGITPIQYLRIIRLNGAHRDLTRANDSQASVTCVALKWGFIELGRFSKEYKLLFQQLPSQTLRQ